MDTKAIKEPYIEDYSIQKVMWTWENVNDWQERIQSYNDD